jgi:hypothetical protein
MHRQRGADVDINCIWFLFGTFSRYTSQESLGRTNLSEDFVISFLGAAVQLAQLSRALRLVWQATPGWTLAWSILLLIQPGFP